MRSGPSPALQNVLVARPGATKPGPPLSQSSSQALVRRDDLLAAAALARAAEDGAARSRPRSGVLAAVSRRFSRISGSLRRRRHSAAAGAAAAALASNDAPRRAWEGRSAVVGEFEQRRRVVGEERRVEDISVEVAAVEDDVHVEEATVSSMRDPASRRLRQVGARDDDDTLLLLPRVASVSFSRAEEESSRSHAPRVRKLPRVSALMPVRAHHRVPGGGGGSPVSSEGVRRSASYGSEYGEEEEEGTRRALCRLPTGMTTMDVERGIEAAVVEIASDGESEEGERKEEEGERRIWGRKGEVRPGEVRMVASGAMRSRSEAHHQNRPRSDKDDAHVITAFSRRISSSTHSARRMLTDSVVDARGVENKAVVQKSQDFALFEDDYLSFQGFHGHGQPESSRSHYQSMSSLLRNKRISSVTDSHSEDSDEGNVKAIGSTDSRWRMGRRPPMVPYVFRMKRGVVLDDEE